MLFKNINVGDRVRRVKNYTEDEPWAFGSPIRSELYENLTGTVKSIYSRRMCPRGSYRQGVLVQTPDGDRFMLHPREIELYTIDFSITM